MENQNEKVVRKQTFTMEVEVFADTDEELNDLKQDIGGEVFGRLDVLSVTIS